MVSHLYMEVVVQRARRNKQKTLTERERLFRVEMETRAREDATSALSNVRTPPFERLLRYLIPTFFVQFPETLSRHNAPFSK